jgi:pSer/pThr/pTyr-binding forkhead associated (FHA) protein
MTVGAYCRIRLSDGRVVDLGPGDIIGRLETATLRINEPQLSEAHALVSLRGEQLVLLALRGVVSVGGRPVSSAAGASRDRLGP